MAKLYYHKWSTKTGETEYNFATDDHYIVMEINTRPQESHLHYSIIPMSEVETRRKNGWSGTPSMLGGDMNIALKNKYRELIQRIFEANELQNLGWYKMGKLKK